MLVLTVFVLTRSAYLFNMGDVATGLINERMELGSIKLLYLPCFLKLEAFLHIFPQVLHLYFAQVTSLHSSIKAIIWSLDHPWSFERCFSAHNPTYRLHSPFLNHVCCLKMLLASTAEFSNNSNWNKRYFQHVSCDPHIVLCKIYFVFDRKYKTL